MFLNLLYYTKTFLVRAHWLGMATLMLSFMPDQLQSRKRWVFHIFFLERHYYTVKLFFFLQCVKLLFFVSSYMQKYLKKLIRSMISFLFFRWPKTKLVIKNTKNVVLHDMVPFLQFKKREKYPWRSVTFSKVAGF